MTASLRSTVSPRRAALVAALLFAAPLRAQQESYVKVVVTPDHPGWTYHVGERARFAVSVLRAGYPVPGASVKYEVGPELMKPTATGALGLAADGRAVVDGGTMREPGFIRLKVSAQVDGKTYEGAGTAGFDPQAIKPYAVMPEDFASYWEAAIEQARKIPLAPTMTLVPEQSTAEASVYHVSFQVDKQGSRIYGMLSVPTAPGKYPVILQVPGAGVRPYPGSAWAAARGVVHLAIGVHGIPVNMEQRVYDALAAGALSNYWTYGIDSRDAYYYHRVIVGAIRAGDFLFSLPQADGRNYGVYGASQGGALSIITAALDRRVTRLSAIHPALSDHEAFLHGRAGGWPRLLSDWFPQHRNPQTTANLRYYDVANFARLVRVPGWYSWGYNDDVCPPTSTYAAYNVVPGPKQLFVVHETAHWTYPEQWDRAFSFLADGFKGK